MRTWLLILSVMAAATGCSFSPGPTGLRLYNLNYDFNKDQTGWSSGFSEYNYADSSASAFKAQSALLPTNVALHQQAIEMSSNNTGKNLFMFLKTKVTGLAPLTNYTLVFELDLVSNAAAGKAQGDSVFVKVGASGIEPKTTFVNDVCHLNIDKGYPNTNGVDLVVVGNIATTPNAQDYSLIVKGNSTYTSNHSISAISNDKGEVWLIVGTDSMYKGTTTVFYASVNVVISASM